MKELQELINKWKHQVGTKQEMIDDSVHVNERRRLRGEQYQLELCITDAELLLAKMSNSEQPPQLDKGSVSSSKPNKCTNCGSTDVIMFDSDNDMCMSCGKFTTPA